jgi:hypothetical protein
MSDPTDLATAVVADPASRAVELRLAGEVLALRQRVAALRRDGSKTIPSKNRGPSTPGRFVLTRDNLTQFANYPYTMESDLYRSNLNGAQAWSAL